MIDGCGSKSITYKGERLQKRIKRKFSSFEVLKQVNFVFCVHYKRNKEITKIDLHNAWQKIKKN